MLKKLVSLLNGKKVAVSESPKNSFFRGIWNIFNGKGKATREKYNNLIGTTIEKLDTIGQELINAINHDQEARNLIPLIDKTQAEIDQVLKEFNAETDKLMPYAITPFVSTTRKAITQSREAINISARLTWIDDVHTAIVDRVKKLPSSVLPNTVKSQDYILSALQQSFDNNIDSPTWLSHDVKLGTLADALRHIVQIQLPKANVEAIKTLGTAISSTLNSIGLAVANIRQKYSYVKGYEDGQKQAEQEIRKQNEAHQIQMAAAQDQIRQLEEKRKKLQAMLEQASQSRINNKSTNQQVKRKQETSVPQQLQAASQDITPPEIDSKQKTSDEKRINSERKHALQFLSAIRRLDAKVLENAEQWEKFKLEHTDNITAMYTVADACCQKPQGNSENALRKLLIADNKLEEHREIVIRKISETIMKLTKRLTNSSQKKESFERTLFIAFILEDVVLSINGMAKDSNYSNEIKSLNEEQAKIPEKNLLIQLEKLMQCLNKPQPEQQAGGSKVQARTMQQPKQPQSKQQKTSIIGAGLQSIMSLFNQQQTAQQPQQQVSGGNLESHGNAPG